MGLIYGRNLQSSTRWTTLTVAVAAVVAILLLLWFGSLRNPPPVSADSGRSSTSCQQPTVAPCDEAVSAVRPIVQPGASSADYAMGAQEAEAWKFLSVSTTWNAGLPGMKGQVQSATGGFQAFGEGTIESPCFLDIDCWESIVGMTGEQLGEGRGLSGLITY